VIQDRLTTHVKIGFTGNMIERMRQLRCSNPGDISVVASFDYETKDDARMVEMVWHKCFKQFKLNREWFTDGILAKVTEIGRVDPKLGKAYLFNNGLMPRNRRKFVLHPTKNKMVAIFS
jgi:hypothetical protein